MDRSPWLRRRALRAFTVEPGLFSRILALHVGDFTPPRRAGESLHPGLAAPDGVAVHPHLDRRTEVGSRSLLAIDALDSPYARRVNPQWVRVLKLLGMNEEYSQCESAHLRTREGRRILDF